MIDTQNKIKSSLPVKEGVEKEQSRPLNLAKPEEKLDQKEMAKRLKEGTQVLNEQMSSLGTNLHFGFNEDAKQMFVSVTEKDTGKVVRQIPTKEALELIKHMKDAIGLIFDKES